MKYDYDAVVVGGGPNGLAAAVTMAKAGRSVLLIEANDTVGGSCRTAELTLPGFRHDVCSAIHPLAVASPFFQSLSLDRYGLKWIQPELPLAHPLEGSHRVLLHRPMAEQIIELAEDGLAYQKVINPFVENWQPLATEILQPLLHFPKSPFLLSSFGMKAMRSATGLAHASFRTEAARALFGGLAAHSFLRLEQTASSATGLVLGALAHAVGWPMPEGGAGRIAGALAAYFTELGGKIVSGRRISRIDELPPARAVFLDLSPRQIVKIANDHLPERYLGKLENYEYGPAAFKVDYALSSPIPWRSPDCLKAGTVHVGGTLGEIAAAERQIADGEIPQRPFVLVAQQSLFDASRAPKGKHTAWAYCHVPHACTVDMTSQLENQIERFAPGFKDCVLARSVRGPAELEAGNANLIGGDINGGLADLNQLLARPILAANPYKTPMKGVYICSASTPPGGGVHGMCGYNAASRCLNLES